ncbi:ATP-binding cassette domain-containing protein, partial [Elstera litoralis]|uniref:ATP-binding cassette domain-containing protein n=1 Tax=Elstera litoralis TaxID=552518 RepID=UPI0012EE15EB
FAATTLTETALLIADEPTKGLDAPRRDDVAQQLRAAAARGTAVMVITHDLTLARLLGGRMQVMLDGAIIESGATETILTHPRHAYTRALLAADPSTWRPDPVAGATPVIEGRGLSLQRGGVRLFEGLDIAVGAGEIVAVSGPSGCGKTSLGNILLGLVAPDAGSVTRARARRGRFRNSIKTRLPPSPQNCRCGGPCTMFAPATGSVGRGRKPCS